MLYSEWWKRNVEYICVFGFNVTQPECSWILEVAESGELCVEQSWRLWFRNRSRIQCRLCVSEGEAIPGPIKHQLGNQNFDAVSDNNDFTISRSPTRTPFTPGPWNEWYWNVTCPGIERYWTLNPKSKLTVVPLNAFSSLYNPDESRYRFGIIIDAGRIFHKY